ncbi:MAG TPA: M81 family metallopeptidase [Dongiaceae bacterium]|nr:M81 family metallopeptidase [Dongiaceae bacterium]
MPKRKLAIARLWYEANSFTPMRAGLADFQSREWVSGEAARRFYADTATEIGGVLDIESNYPDWEFHYLHCAAAPPGGLIETAAMTEIARLILEGLLGHDWDAVYLSLHGATATADDPTPELHLLQKVRNIIGKTPLGASFDLHANLGAETVALLDATSGYHTYPHVDMHLAAQRTLRILIDKAEGRVRPQIAIAKLPAILPSFNMRTADGPMAEMQKLADEWRGERGILDVSIYGGFAYGDSPFAGPSVVAVAEDAAAARQAADALAGELAARRDRFYVELPDPAEGLRRALATKGSGPAIVLDPPDNPLSGGIGDTPSLLRALLATARPAHTAFGFFWDPPLVAECHRLGEGATLRAKLGGRVTPDFGAPVPVEAKIVKLTDGRFRNEGPYEHQLPMDVGRTVLLEVEGIQVVVTESCQTPNDPAYFRLHGIDPEKLDLLCVKAKNHFRAAFTKMARCLIDVDAPGPAAASLAHYKFRHAPQGLYVGKSSI